MKRNNLWNRIFHNKELLSQKEEYLKAKALTGFGPETIQFINVAKTLDELLAAHKKAWIRGYQNENLGPCSWGMFRTQSIPDMKPSEVYLGNIWGLWTFNIPYWNEHSEVTMVGNGFGINEDMKCYELIMRQYRSLLLSNINAIIKNAKDYIVEYNENR